MGVVWAAVNELTSGEVALKLILQSTEELRLRLLREARICGGLKHRNVIEVHDVGQTEEGDPFLVMQLLSGETSKRLSTTRPLPEWPTAPPPAAPRVESQSNAASTGSNAEGEIDRQDAYWWRRGGPRGTATVGAVAGLGVPFLARDTAVAPFSGTPAPDGEADLKTDIGLVITTLMPRPTSTVSLPAPAAVTPAKALGIRAVRSALERLLMGRRALVAILAGGVAVLAVGVGAYEARGGLSTGVPEAVKDARPNPPERLDEPAAPTAAPTPIVSPPSLPIVEIVSPLVPPEVKPPAKKKQAPPAAIKDNQKAGVIAPSRNNPKKWLN